MLARCLLRCESTTSWSLLGWRDHHSNTRNMHVMYILGLCTYQWCCFLPLLLLDTHCGVCYIRIQLIGCSLVLNHPHPLRPFHHMLGCFLCFFPHDCEYLLIPCTLERYLASFCQHKLLPVSFKAWCPRLAQVVMMCFKI